MNSTYRNSGRGIYRPQPKRSQAGYSIFDLITTSAVAGVLSLGAVSMNGAVQDTRMTAAVNQLMADLSLARSEAIKRGAPITLCKSKDAATCSDEAAWRDGWISFTDPNKNREVDAGETIIHGQESLAGNLSLRYSESGYTYVRYNSSGEASRAATFTFCDGRGADKAKAVIVFWTGRPRISTRTSEDKPLSCS